MTRWSKADHRSFMNTCKLPTIKVFHKIPHYDSPRDPHQGLSQNSSDCTLTQNEGFVAIYKSNIFSAGLGSHFGVQKLQE